jgi:hypothetical protein
MSIDEKLKENLIADVENICCIDLKDQQIEMLKRCFEITIGHHYANTKQVERREELLWFGIYLQTKGVNINDLDLEIDKYLKQNK